MVAGARHTAREDQHPVGLRSIVQKELCSPTLSRPRCRNGGASSCYTWQ